MRIARIALLAGALLLGAQPAHAQDKNKPSASERASERRAARKAARAKKARAQRLSSRATARDGASGERAEKDKEAASTPEQKPVPESAASAAPAPPPALDGDESVRKEGDVDVKTVEFSGLDIEGQLKTPQLLYFLTRLRAEFGRPRLPHRSFMPELSRSSGEKALR